MRRNLTSFVKFTLLCVFMVFMTAFMYKTFFSANHRHNDSRKLVASAQESYPKHGAFFMGNRRNVKNIKIDWHDYKYIESEKQRHGIGEHGEAAFLPPGLEDERKRLFDQNGFNGLLSDKIALNRSVKDIRHKE